MIKYIIPICAISLTVSLAAPTVLAQQDTPQPEGRPATGVGFSGICEEDRIQMIRPDGRLVCVYPDTAERMVLRGWEVLQAEAGPAESAETMGAGEIRQPEDVGIHDDNMAVPVADDGAYGPVAVPVVDVDGSDPRLAGASDDSGDDNADSPYYDKVLYYVAYDRITLEGLRELPNTKGFWSQHTRAYAEDILMPRLAGAIGDRVILPVGYDGRSTDRYDTEMGNVFLATHRDDSHPDIIRNLRYQISQDLHPGEFEEFARTFAGNAGFNIGQVNNAGTSISLYSANNTVGRIKAINFPGHGEDSYTEINVHYWSDDPVPSDYPMINRAELTRRAYDFAVRHMDMYNEDTCRLELREKYAGVAGGNFVAGIPVSFIQIGNCHDPDHEGRTRPMSISIDGVTGTIMWPTGGSAAEYLADDWFEKIKHEIPESAWVTDGEDA